MGKFLIIGDLHGQKPNIHFKDYDAIIAPGDFCSDGFKKYIFQVMKENMENPDLKRQWYDVVGKEEAQKMVDKSIKDGRENLEFLNSLGVPVFAVPGNWDVREISMPPNDRNIEVYKKMVSGLENVKDIHHKIVDFKDFQIIGHGIISGPEYPQYDEDLNRAKMKGNLDEIKKDYEEGKGKVFSLFESANRPVIFLSHNVPYNTRVDMITWEGSPRKGQHFGSLIAREACDKYQPVVCIGGHMHEHHDKDILGKTVVINAGFGSIVNTLLEVDGSDIKGIEFHGNE